MAVTGVYIFEISKESLHGALGLSIQIFVVLGILLAVAIGSCMEWDYLALVFIALMIPYVIGESVQLSSSSYLSIPNRKFAVCHQMVTQCLKRCRILI